MDDWAELFQKSSQHRAVYGKKTNYEFIQVRTASSFCFKVKEKRLSCGADSRFSHVAQAPVPGRCFVVCCYGWGCDTWKQAISYWDTALPLWEFASDAVPGFPA
jgi:hypothetical protein